MIIVIFAGEYFLYEDRVRYRKASSNLAVNGFKFNGFNFYDNESYSTHFTYGFNIFVMMTLFNFFNVRRLNDEINIFYRIG